MGWWRSARTRWRKFRGLPAAERRLFVRALLLLPAVALALRLVGLRRCQGMLARFSPPRPAPADGPPAEDIARLVAIAARYAPGRANCLHRSLVLWWSLRRLGRPGELRIGVRKCDGRLEAHAWVEQGGQTFDDTTDQRPYVPFAGPIPLPELRRA
jgi:hypothetical protein